MEAHKVREQEEEGKRSPVRDAAHRRGEQKKKSRYPTASAASADDVTRTWHAQTLALSRRAASLTAALVPSARCISFFLSCLCSIASPPISVCDVILLVPPLVRDAGVSSGQDKPSPYSTWPACTPTLTLRAVHLIPTADT